MYFIGNPILVHTNAQTVSNTATFHRVIATIAVSGYGDSMSFEQSQTVSNGQTNVTFDISSSLRAYAEKYEYKAVTGAVTFPTFKFSVSFRDEYMNGGRITSSAHSGDSYNDKSAILGAYTDLERLSVSDANTAETAFVSLRPSSSMLITDGKMNVVTSGRTSTLGGTSNNVYIVPDDGHSFYFQFVNTRGVIESACAFCYASEAIKGGSNTHVRSLRETFSQMSHRLNVKDPSYAAFSFSSGYVDPEWARWWAFEFAKAKQHWVYLHSQWIPCSVEVKDGASIISRSKNELLHIDFDCIPDINGPL